MWFKSLQMLWNVANALPSYTHDTHGGLFVQLKLMATVHQTQPMLQLLLSIPDYVAALDLIATTQEILVLELAGVHSFR